MKKLSYLFIVVILSGLTIISACKKSDDDTVDKKPTITFKGGSDYISSDVTIATGDSIKVGVIALSNTNSNAKLNKFTLTLTSNNIPQVLLDSTLNISTFDINFFITFANESVFRLSAKITDKDGESQEIAFNVTVVASAGPIYEYSNTVLAAQHVTDIGSSFASMTGDIWLLATAKANANKVDFLYFYGATNLATLASPADVAAGTIYNDTINGLQTWSVRNNTLFKKITTAVDWESITNDALIVELTAEGVTETKINELAVGNVLAFITDPAKPEFAGKKGLIKITAINTGDEGDITFDVKVQE